MVTVPSYLAMKKPEGVFGVPPLRRGGQGGLLGTQLVQTPGWIPGPPTPPRQALFPQHHVDTKGNEDP